MQEKATWGKNLSNGALWGAIASNMIFSLLPFLEGEVFSTGGLSLLLALPGLSLINGMLLYPLLVQFLPGNLRVGFLKISIWTSIPICIIFCVFLETHFFIIPDSGIPLVGAVLFPSVVGAILGIFIALTLLLIHQGVSFLTWFFSLIFAGAFSYMSIAIGFVSGWFSVALIPVFLLIYRYKDKLFKWVEDGLDMAMSGFIASLLFTLLCGLFSRLTGVQLMSPPG
jgi:hypothetical protein